MVVVVTDMRLERERERERERETNGGLKMFRDQVVFRDQFGQF